MRKPLVALGLAFSASIGAIPAEGAFASSPVGSPLTTAPTQTNPTKPAQAVSGAAIIQTAMKYLGYPYTATGNSPSTGFSCIGFASFVYRQNGIQLPGDLGGALAFAPQVAFSDLLPGDLLYFQNTVWNGLSHVAIYLGGGRFIHAEWYGRGVTISSFNNDATDGNYWIGHYMTANRPWNGPAVAPIVGPTSPGTTAPVVPPGTSTQTQVATGPTAVVNAPSLNVRSWPSMSAAVIQVVPRGTSLTIIRKQGGWYKVQLASGTLGWVMGSYVSVGGTTTVPPASGQNGPTTTTTGPTRTGYPTARRRYSTITVHSSSLSVHSAPSSDSPVIYTAYYGLRLTVLARSGGWIKVRMQDGTVGWVSSAVVSAPVTPSAPTTGAGVSGGKRATVAMNLRSAPSLTASIVTVIPIGSMYKIFAWSNGWAHARTSTGLVGWLSGTLFGQPSTPTYRSQTYRHPKTAKATRTTTRMSGPIVTASVRVHTAPGIKAPVVTVAVAGTHVQVLGYRSGWALVRLPSGVSGYVLGTFVRS